MNTSLCQFEKKSRFKYFSTYPPCAERVQALREQQPIAMKIYEASHCETRNQAFMKVANKPVYSR
ncbi:uncharacterized protein CCR75_002953 [Bremia lactucae]|uniref:Uncharacterized protein n=1 Tax=Bremia lactucae TaxID=4779 RepID=A0A976ILB9_BRELC|nr:hypothetical protein CCR75_002953 [Bremia lactucae]